MLNQEDNAPQSTSNQLRKHWIPKNELDIHSKDIETSRKGQNNVSGKGPKFHSPQTKCANGDEYLHSPDPVHANEMKNYHSWRNTHKQHSTRKRGKARTFKSETNFTCQEGVLAYDFALLVDPFMQALVANENEVSHLRTIVRSRKQRHSCNVVVANEQ